MGVARVAGDTYPNRASMAAGGWLSGGDGVKLAAAGKGACAGFQNAAQQASPWRHPVPALPRLKLYGTLSRCS